MADNWTKLRAAALDSVGTLHELLGDSTVDDRRLILGYLEAKRTLAAAFAAFSVAEYEDKSVMENAKRAIEHKMASRYPGVPRKYLKVKGYGESHTHLLAYLVRRVGIEVVSAELRMLTGDAVHTERRTRELRDLGFKLDARHMAGSDVYVLGSLEPDLDAAAAYLVSRNVRADKSLSKAEATEILRIAGLG
jgi:hypothetical protein